MRLGHKANMPEKKAENTKIQTDRLKDRNVRMKFQERLVAKMNELGLNREEITREIGRDVEEV